jgi:hypothetical protein
MILALESTSENLKQKQNQRIVPRATRGSMKRQPVRQAVLWSRSRGAEFKLPPGAGAEITNCGSGSFLFTTDLKIVTILILLLQSKKVIFKVFYKTIWSRSWSQSPSRNLDLRLHGAGTERNIFGSATLPSRPLYIKKQPFRFMKRRTKDKKIVKMRNPK